MKKRIRLAGALLAASLFILPAGCGGKEAVSENVVFKIGVSTGENDPRNVAARQFAAEIAEKTGGAVTAEIYDSGSLGSDAALIGSLALNDGSVDIVISDASNFSDYEPTMGISAMPFLFEDFDTAWEFMDSEIEAEAEARLIDDNIRVLTHYCNGFRCVTNSKHPIETPEDMKGLLIRTPQNPVIMATMTELGATPQPLDFSELYDALAAGIYDAQENPIPVIYNNNLYEVQDYLSVTNHIYSGMCFAISESVWQKLTKEQQEIVLAAAEASAKADRESNRRQTEELIASLKEAGMEINEPDLEPFVEATSGVLTQEASTLGDLLPKLQDWLAAR
ncbi:MAG: TRAP transporter substrate-binding protein [Lachnospiraceae bacterium]|nr:TRAP transporter substrate-binding protein [Lachnospiraceae bacterium]